MSQTQHRTGTAGEMNVIKVLINKCNKVLFLLLSSIAILPAINQWVLPFRHRVRQTQGEQQSSVFNDKHRTKDPNEIHHLSFQGDTSVMKRNDSNRAPLFPINMPFYYFSASPTALLQCFICNNLHPLNWISAHFM